MKLIGALAEAVEAGYQCGRSRCGQRRADETGHAIAPSPRLADAFLRAYRRGLRAAAQLEQVSFLTGEDG